MDPRGLLGTSSPKSKWIGSKLLDSWLVHLIPAAYDQELRILRPYDQGFLTVLISGGRGTFAGKGGWLTRHDLMVFRLMVIGPGSQHMVAVLQ